MRTIELRRLAMLSRDGTASDGRNKGMLGRTGRCVAAALVAAPAVAVLSTALAVGGPPDSSAGRSPALRVRVTQNTRALMPHQVFELTCQHEGGYKDPTWDVTIDVTFMSPTGKAVQVGGFFYGSSEPQTPIITEGRDGRGRSRSSAVWPCDPADLWKARYAPAELGRWTFQYTFQDVRGERAEGQGTFEVVKGRVPQKGFVRVNPANPFRLVFDDDSPFYPVGFQQGVGDPRHLGSVLTSFGMEGPFRTDGVRPATPPGA